MKPQQPKFDPSRQHRRAKFHYSAYWGTWSLLLTERCHASPGYGPIVEISLTPINCSCDLNALKVRRHCTAPGTSDHYSDQLPPEVEDSVHELFGDTTARWLLSDRTQILGKIDWHRHHQISNGGASLYDIVHPRFRDQLPPHSEPARKAA